MRKAAGHQTIPEWLADHLKGFMDLEQRKLGAREEVELVYIKSLTDAELINRFVLTPFFEMNELKSFEDYLASFPGTTKTDKAEQAKESVLKGFVSITVKDSTYLFEAIKVEASSISEATSEAIVQGPKDAFNENIYTNLNLVRRRYKSDKLKAEMSVIGNMSQTVVAVLYDEDRVDSEVLDELKKRLSNVSIDILQSAGELEKELAGRHFRLFPTTMVTERPDRVVFNLSEGKVAILIDGTGFSIILPSIFNDFFTAMDDKIQLPMVGWFLKGIRYIGLLLTVTLPAFYIAVTSYNPEILKIQIALLIAGSRATVPYPSFMEVILMLLMMEFLTEASLRLPKAIGPTATTVGGLILGQAATQAGLVADVMIILVSAVAISNFVIPLNMMGFTVRVIKYGFILLATLLGLLGVVVGLVGLVMYACGLRSFGKPYLRGFALDYMSKKRREV
ncbi:spore germination protein [Paenibacillus sp. CAA11]|uniref:spore germination protein n=1 Tax=Paenibacillus sp. CAA11 TaxID=1532905 RepID=UPI001F2CD77B|nr:spore germination protein [Paenibacillus sp. CAA11]